MREASEYYREAFEKAWGSIQQRLDEEKRRINAAAVEVESVTYDADSHISEIDELPREPKAADPEQVPIIVSIEVVYRILR